MRFLMNDNMLQAFARNGLQTLQWCMLVLLYEADQRQGHSIVPIHFIYMDTSSSVGASCARDLS